MSGRICLVGETDGPVDEGTRGILEAIRSSFPPGVSAFELPCSVSGCLWNFTDLLRFRPSSIVYLTGPTPRSLMALSVLSQFVGGASRVILGAHPMIAWDSFSGRMFRPDHLFALSRDSLSTARSQGVSSSLFFLGADRSRFRPIGDEDRDALRVLMGIARDEHVILHVGHWRSNRNLRLLAKVAEAGHIVMFIASSRFSAPTRERVRLEKSGVRVIPHFVNDIERYYQAADVYLLPVRDPKGVIEQPLSVLEALATGLPVVAFPVNGIPDLAEQYGGLHIAGGQREVLSILDESKSSSLAGPKASPPDWHDVAARLVSRTSRVGTES